MSSHSRSPFALSPRAQEAVARVRALLAERERARWSWWSARSAPAALLAAVAELGALAELGTLPLLLALALDRARLVRREAQRALEPLARTQLACAEALVRPLLRRCEHRELWHPPGSATWGRARIAAAIARQIDPEHGAAFAAFATLQGNGWLREAALSALGRARRLWAWGYAARLALDHVAAVRTRAIARLRAWDPELAFAGVLAAPSSLLRLRGAAHAETRALAAELWDAIHSPARWPEIERALASSSAQVRLAWCEAVADGGPPLAAAALACLRRDPTQRLRLRAAELQRARSAPSAVLALARELLQDQAGKLRLEGLRWCGELADAAELRERVQRALLDRDRNVRELARYLARTRCDLDALALYRETIESESWSARAVAHVGLAEATPFELSLDPEDEARLARALRDPSSHVRAAALEALGERDFERHRAEVLAAVLAPSAGERAAAFRALSRRGGSIRPAELAALRPLAELAPHRYAPLIRRAGTWTALLEILRLDPTRCGALSAELQRAWERRRRNGLGEPSSAERAALLAFEPALSAERRAFLAGLGLEG